VRGCETYTWGAEVKCFLPQSKVQELGISVGSYYHGHPLPYPLPQGWTAERDGSLRSSRRRYEAGTCLREWTGADAAGQALASGA